MFIKGLNERKNFNKLNKNDKKGRTITHGNDLKHRKRVIFPPGAGTRKIEAERWNEIKRDTICLSKSNAAATLICRPFPFKSRRSSRIDPFALKRNQTEAEKSSRKSEWLGGKGKIR